ncbi:dihydrofolate reductase [Vibrio phage 1.121.O._10N.286.46.C4]|nr:dihydrofolate reductase [Vibrio phage 1.121.O._10N.286.46.C4]
MTIKMIIATDSMFGIGKDNALPWPHQKEDMQYFREQTEGTICVMGRRTFDSLPFEDGLPKRVNWVLSSKVPQLSKRGYYQIGTNSKYVNLPYLGTWVVATGHIEDYWIIGGSSIYKQLLPYADEIHHSIIDGVYDCDTFFHMDFLEYGWKMVDSKSLSDKVVVNVWRRSEVVL